MGLLFLGDTIIFFGILFVIAVVVLKFLTLLIKKEFELFFFLLKLGAMILIGGGLCLFLGRHI